jgi:ubiquinone/menaquinone biosynthesis C-methylase UbiE
MISKTKRTHDSLYLKENRYEDTKEMFKFIFKNAFPKKKIYKNQDILDMGCAAGEFIYYLKKKLKKSNKIVGADVRFDLLKKARQNISGVTFLKKSVIDKRSFKKKIFDKIFMIGVHPIFDSFEKCFSNLIDWTKKNGEIYICDMFNPYPVDVILRYKLTKNYNSKSNETGWNIFSKASVSNFLKKNKKVKSISFTQFHMPFDLGVNKNDIVRSWTFKNIQKKRIMTNGLSIIQNQILLRIKLN